MAADGGGMFLDGQPLTSSQKKKDRGLKMADDGGSVFFGGRPLTRKGKKDGGLSKDDKVGNVAFNEDNRNEIRQSQSD